MVHRRVLKVVISLLLAGAVFSHSCDCNDIFTEKPGVPKYYEYGPFTGIVVDMDTGEPIAGALVYFSANSQGQTPGEVLTGVPDARDGVREYMFTGKDGKYSLPMSKLRRYGSNLKAEERAYYFEIYKEGYVSYNQNIIFPCKEGRKDFKWQNNVAKLEPWRDYYTYTDHLMFVPGFMRSNNRNPALEVAKWERAKESEEIDKALEIRGRLGRDGIFKYVSCDNKKKALQKETETGDVQK